MTFDPNVPENPSDSLATTQPEFLTNFLSLYNTFLVNHVALDAGATAGHHTIIELVEQENPLQTGVSEISVYTKEVAGQTDQVFLRYQGNGQEIQLTNYQLYSLNQPVGQTAFFTFLPGKILVYFGSFTTLPNNVLSLFPAIAKKIISVSFCPIGNTPTFKPKIVLQQPSSGFFTGINVTAGVFFNQAPPASYYIVMANI
jgi:hypothetical protein